MGLLVHRLFAKKNTATTINFALSSAGADTPYTGAAPANTDVSIVLDEAAVINPAAAPVSEGVGIWSLALAAGETNGDRVSIAIDNGNIDCTWIFIKTTIALESLSIINAAGSAITATSAGSNGHGLVLAGNGTGEGLSATGGTTGNGIQGIGGATSGAGILGTATAGNSSGLAGAGQGTGPGLGATGGANGEGILATGVGTGYGFKATAASASLFNTIFDVQEAAEPTAAISNTATMLSILQHLKRRFFNLVTQDTTLQRMYKDNSTDLLASGTVSDNGSLQSKGKFT